MGRCTEFYLGEIEMIYACKEILNGKITGAELCSFVI